MKHIKIRFPYSFRIIMSLVRILYINNLYVGFVEKTLRNWNVCSFVKSFRINLSYLYKIYKFIYFIENLSVLFFCTISWSKGIKRKSFMNNFSLLLEFYNFLSSRTNDQFSCCRKPISTSRIICHYKGKNFICHFGQDFVVLWYRFPTRYLLHLTTI